MNMSPEDKSTARILIIILAGLLALSTVCLLIVLLCQCRTQGLHSHVILTLF